MIPGLGLLDRLGAGALSGGFAAGALGAGATPPTPPLAGANSFAAALADAATSTVATLGKAESLSMQALSGEAHARDVVDAVMSAEQSLQAAIAIRDKIVTAYLEVSRMAI